MRNCLKYYPNLTSGLNWIISSQKILQDRGHVVGSEYLKYLKKERLEMLAKPEPSQAKFIWAGYIFAILGAFGNCDGLGNLFLTKKIAQRKCSLLLF
jgi:hypothetical protein